MRSRIDVALALAYRQTTVLLKNPSLFLPPMLFPLMNFLAFAGGLSQLRNVPGFDFTGGYTAFTFVFVLLQSAAFGGVFAGFGIARDFERGFAKRLLVSAPQRSGIILGYGLAALVRWAMIAAVLTTVALISGMQVGGSGVDLFGLYALGVIFNQVGLLWACGVAMRFRTV
jgi:ABC-2 type transport system permease protein